MGGGRGFRFFTIYDFFYDENEKRDREVFRFEFVLSPKRQTSRTRYQTQTDTKIMKKHKKKKNPRGRNQRKDLTPSSECRGRAKQLGLRANPLPDSNEGRREVAQKDFFFFRKERRGKRKRSNHLSKVLPRCRRWNELLPRVCYGLRETGELRSPDDARSSRWRGSSRSRSRSMGVDGGDGEGESWRTREGQTRQIDELK